MEQKRYGVTGMSCEHCAAGIRTGVGAVPGVREVVVDVAARTVVVQGAGVDDGLVRDAVVAAGFGVSEDVGV
ncbi:heavy-metal-associated domain-containing protein [Streptomyces sp. NPDC048290]|uniref:heavy-metal-associated domain-containing protein n=1 Tax=Streptomyces sp. NPDC048290 TaxID=3155811 RepID=UPI0034350D9E